jgi:hypothetical protein
MEYLDTYILPHWPFVAVAVILMVIGQVVKTAIFTKKRALSKGKMQWLFWWGWKLLPLYPVLVGLLIGLVWINPEGKEPAWSYSEGLAYFGLAGTVSIFLFDVLKGVFKQRGFDLHFPGSENSNSSGVTSGQSGESKQGTDKDSEGDIEDK